MLPVAALAEQPVALNPDINHPEYYEVLVQPPVSFDITVTPLCIQ